MAAEEVSVQIAGSVNVRMYIHCIVLDAAGNSRGFLATPRIVQQIILPAVHSVLGRPRVLRVAPVLSLGEMQILDGVLLAVRVPSKPMLFNHVVRVLVE